MKRFLPLSILLLAVLAVATSLLPPRNKDEYDLVGFSRLPTLVSVYDCSFVRFPELCTPQVRAFDGLVRDLQEFGETVHRQRRPHASREMMQQQPAARPAGQ